MAGGERRSSSALVRALMVVFAVNGALYGSVLPRFPQIADRIGASEATFGLALLGAGVGGLLGAAAVTMVARRVGGPARAVLLAGPVMVAGVAVAGMATSPSVLFVALVLVGFADGIVDPAMNAVAAAEQERTGIVVMGRLHATWSAATLGATGIGALIAGAGISVPVHVGVAAALLLPILVGAARSLVRHGADLRAGGDVTAGTDSSADGVSRARPTGRRGRSGAWVAAGVVGFAAVWVEIPPQEWSGLLLQRELGTGPGLAGLGPFTFLAGVLAGRLVLDRLVARHGWRPVTVGAAVAALVGMGLGLAVAAAVRSPWPLLAGMAVAGVGAAPHFPFLFDRADAIAARLGLPPDAGAGFVSVVTRLSFLTAPVIVGQIAERAGLFVALATVPVLAAAMLPALLYLIAPRGTVPAATDTHAGGR